MFDLNSLRALGRSFNYYITFCNKEMNHTMFVTVKGPFTYYVINIFRFFSFLFPYTKIEGYDVFTPHPLCVMT